MQLCVCVYVYVIANELGKSGNECGYVDKMHLMNKVKKDTNANTLPPLFLIYSLYRN